MKDQSVRLPSDHQVARRRSSHIRRGWERHYDFAPRGARWSVGRIRSVGLLWPRPDIRLLVNTTAWNAVFYRDYCRRLAPVFQNRSDRVRQSAAGKDNLLPEADAARYFIDEEAKQANQRALAASRAKAADGRERRSVEKLTAAVRYGELAAEFFEFRAQATRPYQSGVRGLYASDIGVVSLSTD